MSKQLYFTLPNLDTCKLIITELTAAGLDVNNIKAAGGKNNLHGTLPEANAFHLTELRLGILLGLFFGTIAGSLGGLLVIYFPPAGVQLANQYTLLITTIIGLFFGLIISALVAKEIPNRHILKFQWDMTKGGLLLIVSVPNNSIQICISIISKIYPKSKISIF